MSQSSSKESTQSKQSANESEADIAKRKAGVPDKSSHDAKSRIKAGKEEGAGGGAKQEQKHR